MKHSKEACREKCKLIRAALSSDGRISGISDNIVKKIIELEEFKKARNVLLFYPKEGEVDLLGLLDILEFGDKNFFLPRCVGDDMVVCPYKKGDELTMSAFKVMEPATAPLEDVSILDIILVPALCADKDCHRIGYGKGCYDRFFKKHRNLKAKKIIVLPSEMTVEKIDVCAHDIACDMVIEA